MAAENTPATRTHFIRHQGLEVVLLDYSDITDPKDALAAIEASRLFFAGLTPDGSQYTLTDVCRTHYDKDIVEALKGLAAHNRPYVRAAAIVTDSRMQRTMASLVGIFSRRKLAAFETRADALAFLLAESRKAPASAPTLEADGGTAP